MSDLNILRRIADRGLRAAQKQNNGEMIDLWQHTLDELQRTTENYGWCGSDLTDDEIDEIDRRCGKG
jgi:hypothetical protein